VEANLCKLFDSIMEEEKEDRSYSLYGGGRAQFPSLATARPESILKLANVRFVSAILAGKLIPTYMTEGWTGI
jgi:hypothetical protein